MSVSDLHAALTVLRGALPALEQLAEADVHRAEQDRETAGLVAQAVALDGQISGLRTQLADETTAAEVARQKRVREQAVAVNLVEEKLKDLQRAQQTAEQRLAATHDEAARVAASQKEGHATVEAAYRARLADVVKQETAAQDRLATIQGKITALHGDLAGIAHPQGA